MLSKEIVLFRLLRKIMSIKATVKAVHYKGENNSVIIRADNTAGEAVLTMIQKSGADVFGAKYILDLPCNLKA
jgi:hypothetical protein